MAKKAAASLAILTGIFLILYPLISNFLYENAVGSEVKAYEMETMEQDESMRRKQLAQAQEYNQSLSQVQVYLEDPFSSGRAESDLPSYESILGEVICFVDIPKIDVYLPVYHGTSEEVLEKGIGHVEGSSLPIGGKGTHAVLSGHTGINNAKLFTDLTELEEEDLFFIHVLGETLAYRVCSILVVNPENTENLKIEENRDLVTLLTCTPYGVNSHRLLVTGERVAYTDAVKEEAEDMEKADDSQWRKAYGRALLAGGVLAALMVLPVCLFRICRKTNT